MITKRQQALNHLEDAEVSLASAIQADQTDSDIRDVSGLVKAYEHVEKAIHSLRQISLGESFPAREGLDRATGELLSMR